MLMKLFGTAGIRMKYPLELTPELVMRIGNAIARLNLSNRVFIVHDTRTTSPLLAMALASGVNSAGADVLLVGVAPTPVAGFLAKKYSSIGVSVTASHNPPEYNGLKFYDPEGYEFTRELERMVEETVETPKYVDWNEVGFFSRHETGLLEYYEELMNFIGQVSAKWRPNIVVDCANGASFNITPLIVRSLGGKPFTISCNPDGYFPTRPPEPRRDVLESLLGTYSSVNPAVILAHDGDADRLAVLDPLDGFIKQDRILAFYAKIILEERRGRVVVSVDTGLAVEDIVYEHGGSLERYPLGKTHERVKQLGAGSVVMAGEPWKLIYTSWGPWVDGLLQVALITKAVVEHGKRISEILVDHKIPDYPWDRRSYTIEPFKIRDQVYDAIVEELSSILGDPVKILDIDGYRFEYKDRSWILVRKSGTEPKLRFYMEAMNKERLKDMILKAEKKLVEIVEKNGGKISEVTIG